MKSLKSAILSSSLLLSVKSVDCRTWHEVVDHAVYRHIAVDTARAQLRIEADPFLETPHNSGIHNGLTSPPSASPTSSPCREGSIHYQMNMFDTSGNGWQGTAIRVIGIKDQDTLHTSIKSNDTDSSTYTTTTRLNTNEGNGYVALSNTVQFGHGALLSDTENKPTNNFPLGKVFESALTRGSSDHADICLVPRRCYDIVVYRGSKLEEVSWNLTAMVDNFEQNETAYLEGGAPTYCKFSIPDANGEVFCPTECSEDIPEQYTQNDATLADLFHRPVDTGTDGGFSAIYQQIAGKDKPKDNEPPPKGKYSMFLAMEGEEGEDGEVATKPLDERPKPPEFDVDNFGLPSLPSEEENQGDTDEEEDEDSPVGVENEESPAEEVLTGEAENDGTPTAEEGGDVSTEADAEEVPLETENEPTPIEENSDTPVETPVETPSENEITLVEEGQEAPADDGDQDTPPDEGTFGESGSFIPLTGGGDSVVQSAQHQEPLGIPPNEDDDSLASAGLLEEESDLPLTSEVRSGQDIQQSKDNTLAIPEYSGTMQFQEEEPKVDVSESLPMDPAAPAVDSAGAPVKTDTFHMLLRHGGKR